MKEPIMVSADGILHDTVIVWEHKYGDKECVSLGDDRKKDHCNTKTGTEKNAKRHVGIKELLFITRHIENVCLR